MTQNKDKYQSIRCYNDQEANTKINQLLSEEKFTKVLSFLYPEEKIPEIRELLKNLKTIKGFQKGVIHPYLSKMVKNTTAGLSFSGLKHLDPKKSYLFISNHRDIVLDSAFLNLLLIENKFNTTEIAIGSNLLIFPWIEILVRLNKSFLVKRNLPVREMLKASRELSSYINYTLQQKGSSIWIAQKEGRTKNGNDRTQPALLKMLNMDSDNSIVRSFKKMRIVPVSISYEIEPCDKTKTAEQYIKFKEGVYKKDPKEDLSSMSGGLNNFKGRIHYSFGKPLKRKLIKLKRIHSRNEQFSKLGKIIDDQIYKGYKLFPGNYAAYDILFDSDNFKDKYNDFELEEFTNNMNKQIEDIEGDKKIIKKIFLGIYANPVINKYYLRQKPISFV
ncbi:MAG: 1-acyl-sn-glycerol-3-phosphate acyltransferase [Bacteroidota bacterium]